VQYDQAIRFGLGAIKNVGSGAVQAILAARQRGGPFRDLDDFCERVDYHQLNSRVVESLIKAGAMDCLPGRREQLLADYPRAMAAGQQLQKAREVGQLSMFDLVGETPAAAVGPHRLPDVPPQPRRTLLAWEKELLGVYVSEHPLGEYLRGLPEEIRASLTRLGTIGEELVGQTVQVVGLLVRVRQALTKDGKTMAVAEVEDLDGSMEVVAFPKVFEQTQGLWVQDAVLLIEGRVDQRNERLQIVCTTARALEGALRDSGAAVTRELIPYEEDQELRAPSSEAPPYEEFAAEEEGEDWPEVSPAPPAKVVERAGRPAPAPPRRDAVGPQARPSVGYAVPAARRPVPAGPCPNGRHILIHLPCTDELEQDIRRMQELHALFREHRGQDRLSLLVWNGRVVTRLEPLDRIAYSPEFHRQVEAILGEGSVEVEEEP
ncbi:MAG: OB-fold nucleic acid binding domain-containing protein, partial [Chloroflexia bacterium]